MFKAIKKFFTHPDIDDYNEHKAQPFKTYKVRLNVVRRSDDSIMTLKGRCAEDVACELVALRFYKLDKSNTYINPAHVLSWTITEES